MCSSLPQNLREDWAKPRKSLINSVATGFIHHSVKLEGSRKKSEAHHSSHNFLYLLPECHGDFSLSWQTILHHCNSNEPQNVSYIGFDASGTSNLISIDIQTLTWNTSMCRLPLIKWQWQTCENGNANSRRANPHPRCNESSALLCHGWHSFIRLKNKTNKQMKACSRSFEKFMLVINTILQYQFIWIHRQKCTKKVPF